MKTRHDRISHDESYFILWREAMLHNLSEEITEREAQRDYLIKIKSDYQAKFVKIGIELARKNMTHLFLMQNKDNWGSMPLCIWGKEKIGLI